MAFAKSRCGGTDHEACLIQVGSTGDDRIGGCSAVQSDKVVEQTGGVPRQEVALVSGDPSTDTLEEAAGDQRAEHLRQRPR